MKRDTIIFDLDGTLLDTLEDLADAVNYALHKMNFRERSLKEIRSFVGNGVVNLIERSTPKNIISKDNEECLRIFKKYYSNNSHNKTNIYPDVQNVLLKLKEQGFKLTMVSNKFDAAVKKLSEYYFNDLFESSIGDMEGYNKKPAPDNLIRAVKEVNSSLDKSIYVGDSEVDILTAKNAHIPCVSVLWGFRDRDCLLENGAKCFADSPQQMYQKLMELSRL